MNDGVNKPASADTQERAAEIRPEPAERGSEGTQAPAPDTSGQAVVRVVQPLTVDEKHLGAALGEFMDVRSPAVVALAIAAYRDAERYKVALMDRWEEAEREKDSLREDLHAERQKNAVLEERGRGRAKLRRIQHFALVVGGLVAGGGLSVALNEPDSIGLGALLTLLGLAILSLGTPLFGREE